MIVLVTARILNYLLQDDGHCISSMQIVVLMNHKNVV